MKVTNWDEAKIWQESVNKKWDEYNTPKWSWDCNFKLDFDGPILNVSSRFYPVGDGKWEGGSVSILLMGKEIASMKPKANTLDGLKQEVELYVMEIKQSLEKFLII